VVDAGLVCSDCGEVGVVRTYRPSFHAEDLGDGWAPAGLAERPIDIRRSAEVIGDWTDVPPAILGTSIGSCLTGTVDGPGVVVELATHSWGGAVLVSFGDHEQRVELRSDGSTTMHRVVLHQPDAGTRRRWAVVVAPGVDPVPERNQAMIRSVAELVPAPEAPSLRHTPVNLGNPYPPRFADLLSSLPHDAIVIDVGGGDRCHTDSRVFNFEYMKFPHADFFGDGLHLPIASDSVDLIMSQAVLEHVPDPKRAVSELYRILKPGGRIYAEFAFMQPLHAVPFHFFNITPHGAQLLFTDWEIVSHGTFGGLETTMEWFFRLLDADVKIGAERTDEVLRALRDLDKRLTPADLDYVASAVYVEALKPA
jgi:SAM-dependent methyltransferase